MHSERESLHKAEKVAPLKSAEGTEIRRDFNTIACLWVPPASQCVLAVISDMDGSANCAVLSLPLLYSNGLESKL